MKGLWWFVVIGLIAGWVTGIIMKGRSIGLLGNIVVGLIGAMVGAVALLSLILIVKRA